MALSFENKIENFDFFVALIQTTMNPYNVALGIGALGTVALLGNFTFQKLKQDAIYRPDTKNINYKLPQGVQETMITFDKNHIHIIYTTTTTTNENVKGVVLFSHGNAGNLGSRFDWINLFKTFGYDAVIYDYRGYGKSTGKPSEKGLLADARAVWNWLVFNRGYSANDILLFGNSLGGAVSVQLAHILQLASSKPKGLVIQSSFSKIGDLAPPHLRKFVNNDYDTVKYLGLLQNMPIHIIHSEEDEIVPITQAMKLIDAANENGSNNVSFFPAKGSHNSIRIDNDYLNSLNIFLEKL